MSRDSLKLLLLHLMATGLMIGCLMSAGDGDRRVFTFLAGVLVWPVFGTLKDLYMQIKNDLHLG